MDTATFSLFFALLSLAALALAAGIAVLRFVPAGAGDGLRADVGRAAVPVALVIAAVTTAGSLYYSKVVGLTPCELCWYQRIAAYPLVVTLVVALVRRDARGARPYVVGPCLIGAAIAAYHSWIQAFPPDSGTSFCTEAAPCTARHVWELGFVSLPFMALSAFLSILALMAAVAWGPTADRPEARP